MKLRVRPKSDFHHHASIEELYKVSNEWLSEVKLWQDELHFFQHLIDKYIMKMIEEAQLQHVQKIVDEIIQYNDVDLINMEQSILKHEKHLGLIIEDEYAYDKDLIRREHDHLEDDISSLMDNFKSFKKDVYEVIEHVLKNEKLQHLLQR